MISVNHNKNYSLIKYVFENQLSSTPNSFQAKVSSYSLSCCALKRVVSKHSLVTLHKLKN